MTRHLLVSFVVEVEGVEGVDWDHNDIREQVANGQAELSKVIEMDSDAAS